MTKKLKVFIARYRIERKGDEVAVTVLEQKVRAISRSFVELKDENGYTTLASVCNLAVAYNGKVLYLPGSEDVDAVPVVSRSFQSTKEAKNAVLELLKISKHSKTLAVIRD